MKIRGDMTRSEEKLKNPKASVKIVAMGISIIFFNASSKVVFFHGGPGPPLLIDFSLQLLAQNSVSLFLSRSLLSLDLALPEGKSWRVPINMTSLHRVPTACSILVSQDSQSANPSDGQGGCFWVSSFKFTTVSRFGFA